MDYFRYFCKELSRLQTTSACLNKQHDTEAVCSE